MGVVRLHLNEPPFPPPKEILEAASKEVYRANRYPERQDIDLLVESLAEYSGVPRSHIALGCGGDSLLPAIALISRANQGLVAVPRYSFSMYEVLSEAAGARLLKIEMRPRNWEWKLDFDELLEAARSSRLVIVDNPNNPTGGLMLDEGMVEELLESAGGVVVVDEAYYEFSGFTVAGLTEAYENLIVLRTMSKAFSLAGLRVGYIIAHPRFAGTIRKLFPYPASRPSIAAALRAVIEGREHVERLVSMIRAERELIASRARGLGAAAYKSHTNFLLIDTGVRKAAERLREMGILVRETGISDTAVRVTVGLRKDNELFLEALKSLLKGSL